MSQQVQISQWEHEQLKDKAKRAESADKLRSAMRSLLEVLKNCIIVLWWVMGIGGTVALWFYPAPQNRLQPIVFGAVSIIYALLSRALYKVKEVEAENK